MTPELETHIASIDEQHAELFARINKVMEMSVNAASQKEIEKTLRFLGEYVVKHFKAEEEMMLEYSYPRYEWHREQHKGFIKEFQALEKEYAENGPSEEFSFHLNKSIIDWIIGHIQDEDVCLGKHMSKIRNSYKIP